MMHESQTSVQHIHSVAGSGISSLTAWFLFLSKSRLKLCHRILFR